MEEDVLKNEKQIAKKQAVVKMIIAIISAVIVLSGIVLGGGFSLLRKTLPQNPYTATELTTDF